MKDAVKGCTFYQELVENVIELILEGLDDDTIACQKQMMADFVSYIRSEECMLKDGQWVRRH